MRDATSAASDFEKPMIAALAPGAEGPAAADLRAYLTERLPEPIVTPATILMSRLPTARSGGT